LVLIHGCGDSLTGVERSAKLSARDSYQAFAPIYDEFNWSNDYEMWLGEVLLPELERHGLVRGRVLDVGCGTGRSFAPMLSRGWEVVGCDVSEAMLGEAGRKHPGVPTFVADARDLPLFGRFELVLMLNDVANYLVDDGDLERALCGIAPNLLPGGLLVFDTNTLSLFRSNFATGDSDEMSVRGWHWVGQEEAVELGGTFAAEVSGDGVETHVHRERHWTVEQVRAAVAAAGLELLASKGQSEVGGRVVLAEDWDEERDHKVMHFARRPT
jgi:SAM-dependent methyltransferase